MTNIAILGAGMAGFGAAHRFYQKKIRSTIFEQHGYYGGHATTFSFKGGYTYDDGPHISFTKNERLQKLFAQNVDNQYEQIQAKVNNFWKGHWIKHPVQCNLFGIPSDLVTIILLEIIKLQNETNETNETNEILINTYQNWLEKTFGKTFSHTFPIEYGKKFHTTTADNMSTEWLSPRLYKPSLEEVIQGALSPSTSDVHYVNHFRYPTHGGFISYLQSFPSETSLKLNTRLIELDPKQKLLRFHNGSVKEYDHIVSSIPLTVLIPMIKDTPDDVLTAAQKLACTQCVIVNIAIDRTDISDAHWTYFYDDDYIFSRLSFPHMFSANNVPAKTGSIQAEIYFSEKYKPRNISIDQCILTTINDLKRCQLVKDSDHILFQNGWESSFAQVIFDLDRADNLEIVHGYLNDLQIEYCGRYGNWEYIWTDEAFISGEEAAQRILERIL